MTNQKRTPDITVTTDGTTATMTFSDGRKLSFDVTALCPEMREQALLHGIKQKALDAAALSRDTTTGRTATLEDKYQAVLEVHTRLYSEAPTWNKVKGGAGGVGTKDNLLIEALMSVTRADKAVIAEQVKAMSKEQRAALRLLPEVEAEIRRIEGIRAKVASAGIDTTALMARFLPSTPAPDVDDEFEDADM